MLLQVRRVSTVILHTEMRWKNAIEKFKNVIQVQVRVQVQTQKKAMQRTRWTNLELQTPKTHQNSNQTIHKVQQCTAGY